MDGMQGHGEMKRKRSARRGWNIVRARKHDEPINHMIAAVNFMTKLKIDAALSKACSALYNSIQRPRVAFALDL